MTEQGIEEIIKLIKVLPLKEALALLASKKILDYSKKGYEKIKKIIQEKYNERKYAFVPNKAEALKLKQLYESPDYRQIRLLIPNYRHIDLIRTGLLIAQYHIMNTQEANERTKRIKMQIASRPNGPHLLKIANLPTTPFFSVILKVMYNLKTKEGYSESQLEDQFDELVSLWEKSSFFVESQNTADDIKNFCEKQIGLRKSYFFLLGMKSAAELLDSALKDMDNGDFFRRNGYKYSIIKEMEGNRPRMEVTVYKKETTT